MMAPPRLITQFSITATTADWDRLGTESPYPNQLALDMLPIWRVEERVIGCELTAGCKRDAQRSACELTLARNLTLDQAMAQLRRRLVVVDEATCEG